MKVTVVGLGYVGAVTGACLAELGAAVECVDVDETKVRRIEAGKAPIYEAGLDELVRRHSGGRLRAGTDLEGAVRRSDVTVIAVGTPFVGDETDLSAIRQVSEQIGYALAEQPDYHAVVVKSSVPPGTTRDVVLPILERASGKRAGSDFGVGMNPEFLTEGQAVEDFMSPDRLVLGGLDERVHATLERLYAPFPRTVPRLYTNTTTAELIKFASNALLATSISFANEIADVCAAVGEADVVDVMKGVHLSRYLTPLGSDGEPVRAPLAAFLEAGCGFGGSCLPKDLRALVAQARRHGHDVPVLEATLRTNDARADEVLRLVERELPVLESARVLVLGLAFKPDTDDVRESPALPILARLLRAGAEVTVHDPLVKELPSEVDGASIAADLEAAVAAADAVVLVTRWDEYRRLPAMFAGLDPQPVLVDGRRLLDKGDFGRYAGVGVGK